MLRLDVEQGWLRDLDLRNREPRGEDDQDHRGDARSRTDLHDHLRIEGRWRARRVAPTATGASTFTASEASTSSGTPTALATSPVVTVFAASANGSGTMTVSPTTLSAGSTGNALTFTYTAATGGMSSGVVEVAVPTEWPSAPSLTSTAAGYVTSTCGTLSLVGRTTKTTGVTLAAGQTCTIIYGSKAGGGPGAVAPTATGASTFTASESSTSSGTPTALATSPVVTVAATGLEPQAITFTSTNPSPVTLGAPTYTPTATASSGLPVTITLDSSSSGCTLSGGVVSFVAAGTCVIDANQAGNGTYAAAPQLQQSITINSGAQTMTVSPSTLSAGSKGNTLTFTYTAATGGISSGVVEVAVPTGWPDAPSLTSSKAGYVTSTCGTVSLVGRTIKTTGVTLAAGQTCTIIYGSKAGGGPGAVAPTATGASTFTASEASTSSGTPPRWRPRRWSPSDSA